MSNSNSSSGGSDFVEQATAKIGGSRPLTDDCHSDLDTSTSAISSSDSKAKRRPPMENDDRIAYLEEMIKNNNATLMRLSEDIDSATKKRDKLLEKEEVLTTNETKSLKRIEEDISDKRVDKNLSAAEILYLKAELNALKNPKELVKASVAAEGI